MDNIETERLLLRGLTPTDAPFILAILNSPGWLQYIGDRKVYTLEDAEKYIENRILASYASFGFGMLLMEIKTNRAPAGLCGLVQRAELDNADLGFALLPGYAGQGLANEAARAVMQFAHEKKGLKKLLAIVTPTNQASIKLLEKLGFKFCQNVLIADESLQLYKFE